MASLIPSKAYFPPLSVCDKGWVSERTCHTCWEEESGVPTPACSGGSPVLTAEGHLQNWQKAACPHLVVCSAIWSGVSRSLFPRLCLSLVSWTEKNFKVGPFSLLHGPSLDHSFNTCSQHSAHTRHSAKCCVRTGGEVTGNHTYV